MVVGQYDNVLQILLQSFRVTMIPCCSPDTVSLSSLRAIIMPFLMALISAVNSCYAIFIFILVLFDCHYIAIVSCVVAPRINSRGRESVRWEAVVAG